RVERLRPAVLPVSPCDAWPPSGQRRSPAGASVGRGCPAVGQGPLGDESTEVGAVPTGLPPVPLTPSDAVISPREPDEPGVTAPKAEGPRQPVGQRGHPLLGASSPGGRSNAREASRRGGKFAPSTSRVRPRHYRF